MCSANLTADIVNFSKAKFSGGRAFLVGFIRRSIWPSENVLLGVFFCFYKEKKIPAAVFLVMFVVLNTRNNLKKSLPDLYHHELTYCSPTPYFLSQTPPNIPPTHYTFLLLLKHHTFMSNYIPIYITELICGI